MSSFSARELFNFNLYQEFEDNPQKALTDLHSGLAPKGNEDRLFALAELSFLHAQNSGERSYYLAAAVYAYAFVIPGKRGTPPGESTHGCDGRWISTIRRLRKRPSRTKARMPSRWAVS